MFLVSNQKLHLKFLHIRKQVKSSESKAKELHQLEIHEGAIFYAG